MKVIDWELLRNEKLQFDDSQERKKILTNKKQSISSSLQNNSLTKENYVKSLKNSLQMEKKIAQALKNGNDLDNTRICMHRIKLITEDIESNSTTSTTQEQPPPVKQQPPVKQPPPVKQVPTKTPTKGIPPPGVATLEDPHNPDRYCFFFFFIFI